MVAVKKCPKCSAFSPANAERCRSSKCSYEFTGEEPGSLPKEAITLPVSLPASPSAEEVGRHVAALVAVEMPPERDWVSFGKRLAFSLAGLALVSLVFFMTLHGPPSEIIVVFLGVGGIVFVLGALAAVMGIILPAGYSSPRACVQAFYHKAGGDWLERSFTGAWRCLSPVTRAQLGKVEDWQKQVENDIKQLTERYRMVVEPPADATTYFSAKDFSTREITPDATLVECALEISASQPVEQQGLIIFGSVLVPQRKVVVRRGKKWYLTSGTFDLPN